MAAKSRRKGAAAEQALVRFLCSQGIGSHRVIRTATSRAADEGDVHSRVDHGLIVWQVKAGEAAMGASEALLDEWWSDTKQQRLAARGRVAVLLTQRRGYGPFRIDKWQATVNFSDLAWLHDPGHDTTGLPDVAVRLPLGSLVGQVAR